MDRLKDALATAQRMASAVFTAKADVALARSAHVEGSQIATVLNRALELADLDDKTEARLRAALTEAAGLEKRAITATAEVRPVRNPALVPRS